MANAEIEETIVEEDGIRGIKNLRDISGEQIDQRDS